MGNQIYVPSFNEKGVDDDIMTFRLNKGPGENYDNELIFSEESVEQELNAFDIIVTGHISNLLASAGDPISGFSRMSMRAPPPVRQQSTVQASQMNQQIEQPTRPSYNSY
jgi:hypothetical protein